MSNHRDGVELGSLISRIYEASSTPEFGPQITGLLIKTFCGKAAYVRSHDRHSGAVRWLHTAGHDTASRDAYTDRHARHDPLSRRLADMGEGTTFDGYGAEPAYLEGFLEPRGLGAEMAACVYRDETESVVVGVQRAAQQGPFDPDELDLMRAIGPHLAHAYAVHARFALADCREQGMQAVLERIRCGLILVDAQCRPLFANAEARRLLAEETAATEGSDGFDSRFAALKKAIKLANQDAGVAAESPLANGEHVLALPGRRNGRWVHVQVTRLRGAVGEPQGLSAGLAVFLCRRECRQPVGADVIAPLFRFTPAEARLVNELVAGHTLADIANNFSISINTARCQLKSVFFKTGARNQAELVSLVLGSFPGLPPTRRSRESA